MSEQVEIKIAKYGTREEVFLGKAKMTKGKLTRDDIVFENNKYKSKRAVEKGKALINQLRNNQVEKKEEPEPEPKQEEVKNGKAEKPKLSKQERRKLQELNRSMQKSVNSKQKSVQVEESNLKQ